MGRHARGWRLRDRDGTYHVRFTWKGQPYCFSLFTKDRGEAEQAAAREYAKVVSGQRRKPGRTARQGVSLKGLIAQWIETRRGGWHRTFVPTVESYGARWLDYFKKLDEITTESGRAFGYARLTQAMRKTVLREVSYLRAFLLWAYESGHALDVPVIPPLPRKHAGVRTGKHRRNAVHVTKEEALRIIALLPKESKTIKGRCWPVRARYLVAWETGLRPATLGALKVPEHYRRGGKVLTITDEIDKARYGREVDLTPAARAALESCAPVDGLIFGSHKFYKALKKAACKVLGARRGKDFADYDFRHGLANHMLDQEPNLRGVAYVLGHTRLSTTDKYLKADRKQAKKALGVA